MSSHSIVKGFFCASKWRIGALVSMVILFFCSSAPAAEVKGPKLIGTVSIYSGQVSDILSVGFQATNPFDPTCGSGCADGKISLGAFEVIKAIDAASPWIFLDVARGTHIKQVAVDFVLTTPTGIAAGRASYVLEDVVIVAYNLLTDANSLEEKISLRARRYRVTMTDSLGSATTACWDAVTSSLCN